MEKIKALFFAQYWGKTFINGINGHSTLSLLDINDISLGRIKAVLLLRSVNQLTDDECLNVAAFRGWVSMLNENGNMRSVRRWIDEDINGEYNRRDFESTLAITDYMRSVGILLPFTHLDQNNKPVTLQPNEIIALGWAKVD